MLTGISTTENILIDSSGYSYDISTSKQDLIVTALKNRSDLKALRLSLESGTHILTYNKLKAIPEISILAGYKSRQIILKDQYSALIFRCRYSIEISPVLTDLNWNLI
jgi:outer membrane protein TolC